MKQYEVFQDACYYDLYCVRATDDRDFEHTLHFLKKEEALHAKKVLEHWTKSIYIEMHSREKGLIEAVEKAHKDLIESKPEPEKNCGNCAWFAPMGCEGKAEPCDKWKAIPKPAEEKAEGWEQRLKKVFDNASFDTDGHMDSEVYRRIEAFIRAEIERVREEEKEAILKILMIFERIEQNKHRSEK